MQITLHLTTYDRLGENPVVETKRTTTFDSIPAIGATLMVGGKPFYTTASYQDASGPGVHVFATQTSMPADHAKAMGLKLNSAGYPSAQHFEGETIGELMAFFADYPRDMEVVFTDREVLHAKAKGNAIILRLDDRSEYE